MKKKKIFVSKLLFLFCLVPSNVFAKPSRFAFLSEQSTLIPNLDDDDKDGKADGEDENVNSESDKSDFVRLWSDVPAEAVSWSMHLDPDDSLYARVFWISGSDPDKWSVAKANKSERQRLDPAQMKSRRLEFRLEALSFAGQNSDWDGELRPLLSIYDSDGMLISTLATTLKVTPWLMLPNTARTKEFFISTGVYSNKNMIDQLAVLLPNLGVAFPSPFVTTKWQEMWMQDTVEIGYATAPGMPLTHYALNGLRGADSFAATLLGPNRAVLQVGQNRGLTGEDAWADWFGNLEVSAPSPQFPLGRIYYGINTKTGNGMNPTLVKFLEAQKAQSPFWIDTSWLKIKHVDEIMNVVPSNSSRLGWKLIVASPTAGEKFRTEEPIEYNREIQSKIDKILNGGTYTLNGKLVQFPGVKNLLHLNDSDIIPLPVLFKSGHNAWSNPVNSVHINGTLLLGKTYMQEGLQEELKRVLGKEGMQTKFLDDKVYQDNLGNVHCSSNTLRLP
jgi:protein-arginine deiminase